MSKTYNKIVIFTGAGISAESGVPTFRDSGGLWNQYDINDVCNFNTWEKNYDLVHEFYNKRREELKTVSPNHTHDMIAKWQKKYGDVFNITCNIDDLLERAGSPEVVHLHGFATEMRCTKCDHVTNIGNESFDPEKHNDTYHDPKCFDRVKENIKPNVVFFNEAAPLYQTYYHILGNIIDDETIVIVMGTSGTVVSIQADLYDKPGYKILNNLEPSLEMYSNSGMIWDEEFYEPSTKAVDDIDKVLVELMGY